jgi:hypothetical protein
MLLGSVGVSDLTPCKTLIKISVSVPNSLSHAMLSVLTGKYRARPFVRDCIKAQQQRHVRYTQETGYIQTRNHKSQANRRHKDRSENPNLGSLVVRLTQGEALSLLPRWDLGPVLCLWDSVFIESNWLRCKDDRCSEEVRKEIHRSLWVTFSQNPDRRLARS